MRYIFDHHDINPELYEANFNKRGFFWQLMVLFEKLTFKAADVSIASNHSYRQVAIGRGGIPPLLAAYMQALAQQGRVTW